MTDAVKRTKTKREIRHLVGGQHCLESVGKLYPGMEIFGLTNGQFSKINLIETILNQTGKAAVDVSTWTAAGAEIKLFEQFLNNQHIDRLRFLVDRSFPSRQPKYFQMLLDLFGEPSIRVARTHCKFFTIKNEQWNIAVRTSMNLNENRRIENFEISDSEELTLYLTGIVDGFFAEPFKREGYLVKSGGVSTPPKVDPLPTFETGFVRFD